MKNLTKAELTKLFEIKMKEDQKIPTAKSIDRDKRFPSYRIFKSIFDGKRIREIDELKGMIKENKLIFKLKETFCEDCAFDKKSCGKKMEDCFKEAELLFNLEN